jgi:hypothetical protein
MLGLRILFLTELALKLLDGSVDDGSLVPFSFVGIQRSAQVCQLGFVLLMKTSIFIGGGGLRLLEIKLHQARLCLQDVYLIE